MQTLSAVLASRRSSTGDDQERPSVSNVAEAVQKRRRHRASTAVLLRKDLNGFEQKLARYLDRLEGSQGRP